MPIVAATLSPAAGCSPRHRIPSPLHSTRRATTCLHHGVGGRRAATNPAVPTAKAPCARAHRGPLGPPGHRGCSRRCPTPGSRWTHRDPSGLRRTTGSNPPPGSGTRSSSCAPRCTVSRRRSTSSGLGSVAAQRRPGERRAASPASRRAPGLGRRDQAGAAVRAPAGPAPRAALQRLRAGVRAVPSAPRAPSVPQAGPSRRAGRGARAPLRAVRAADSDGYPHWRG